MGQLLWVETEPLNILANDFFSFPLGSPNVVWTADADWDINNNVAIYDQGATELFFFLRQQGMGGVVGKEYTVAVEILEITCDDGPNDGLQFQWGNQNSPHFKTTGIHYWHFTANGDLTEFQIVSCPNASHTGYLKLNFCQLYEENQTAFLANSNNFGFAPGLYGQSYPQGGGLFSTIYAQRKEPSKIWIQTEI